MSVLDRIFSGRRACERGDHDWTGRVFFHVPLHRGGSLHARCRRCGQRGAFIGYGPRGKS